MLLLQQRSFHLLTDLPQNPLLHLQWNISASLTWHSAPFLQGFGWQGLLPHSPTPAPKRLSPLLSWMLSILLLTSSMRMQPTRPEVTPVLSLTLRSDRKSEPLCFSLTWLSASIGILTLASGRPSPLQWTVGCRGWGHQYREDSHPGRAAHRPRWACRFAGCASPPADASVPGWSEPCWSRCLFPIQC